MVVQTSNPVQLHSEKKSCLLFQINQESQLYHGFRWGFPLIFSERCQFFARAGVWSCLARLQTAPGWVQHRAARQPRARRRQAHLWRRGGERAKRQMLEQTNNDIFCSNPLHRWWELTNLSSLPAVPGSKRSQPLNLFWAPTGALSSLYVISLACLMFPSWSKVILSLPIGPEAVIAIWDCPLSILTALLAFMYQGKVQVMR